MDFAHAVVRQLEAREWCELGLGPFDFTCGTTSPKSQGKFSYGPFQVCGTVALVGRARPR